MNYSDKIREILFESECLWTENNPKEFHALLVSGNHSNGFINMKNLYARHEGLLGLEKISRLMSTQIKKKINDLNDLIVIGAAYGGIIPAYLIAKNLGLPSMWTEKLDDQSQIVKSSIRGKKVLIVEDVITTGLTVLKSMKSIKSLGGRVIDPVVCIVNRSGSNFLESKPIFSGVSFFLKNYSEKQCPWCQRGSKAIKPKVGNNWMKLKLQDDSYE